jgi:hypothetical protein
MQATNYKQLKKLNKIFLRNFDNLAYFCMQKDYYCKKRDKISLTRNCNKKQLAFVYRQIAFLNKKIEYCFENRKKILEQANAISDFEIREI